MNSLQKFLAWEAFGQLESIINQSKEQSTPSISNSPVDLEMEENEEEILEQANQMASEIISRIEQEIILYPEAKDSDSFPCFQELLSQALGFTFDPATQEKLEEFRKLLNEIESAWGALKRSIQQKSAPKQVEIKAEIEVPETWEKEGYALIESDILQDRIVLVRDESCITAIPFEYSGWPIYYADEIKELKNKGATEEELRNYHLKKKHSPGHNIEGPN